MINPARVLLACIVAGLASCGASDNPQLDMCQTITKNLSGDVSEWPRTETKESGDRLTVSADFTLAAGDSGEVFCLYKREMSDRDSGPAPFRTAPSEVTLNGQKISEKALLIASTRASGEKLREVAAETAAQINQANQDVTRKAEQLTEQAETALRDTEKKVGEAAADLGDKARKAATDAVDKVKETLDTQ